MTEDQVVVEVRAAALRVASRLVGPFAAEDVAQEAAVRAVPRVQEIAAYPGPWAVRVATNLSLDLLRQQARTSFSPTPELLARSADADMRLDLRRATSALPERQRQVVALRVLCDLDERTTADLLGISPGSVKRHLHRATAALRTSPHLDLPATPTTKKDSFMRHWTDDFTAAVEPEGGWQGRPWDHWQLEDSPHRVSRVAVIDGEPVLDAEGDEVMEGPGFEFNVVKQRPKVFEDTARRLPTMRPYEVLPGLLGELLVAAKEESDAFSHIWIGEEHLALALAARGAPGVPDLTTVEGAVARTYDGPLAEGRLKRVRARRSGLPYARDPWPKVFTHPVQQILTATEGREPTLEEIVQLASASEHSTLCRLAASLP